MKSLDFDVVLTPITRSLNKHNIKVMVVQRMSTGNISMFKKCCNAS